jgi:flagella basal body P-ring formation protein FlgA
MRARGLRLCGTAVLAVLVALLATASPARAAESPMPLRPQGWWLVVRPAACAQGPKVLMGDIAEPRGDLDDALWKKIAARQLWNAPERNGHQTALNRERIVALLKQHAEDLAPACVLPQQMVIQRGGTVESGETLAKRVVGFLTERVRPLGGEPEVTDLHVPEYVFLPSERDSLELGSSAAVRPGRVNLLFELRSAGGKVTRRFAASAFLNVWKPLPVATRGMSRLEALNLANVQYKRKNLAYNPTAWDGSGGPWRMARNVGVEQVIHKEDLEPVPVIAKGGKVNLVFEGTGIRLSVKAEALADAGVGQAVQVRNLQSNRKITATVLDAETVIVR